MGSLTPDTQSGCQQQKLELLMTSAGISEPSNPGLIKDTNNMTNTMCGETTKHCRQQITTPASPTTDSSLETQDDEIEPLFHCYTCCKLSFLIKMTLLRSIKSLGYALPEEDVKREEKAIEDTRAKALEAWEQIRNRGFSYDAVGYEYLRSCTLH